MVHCCFEYAELIGIETMMKDHASVDSHVYVMVVFFEAVLVGARFDC